MIDLTKITSQFSVLDFSTRSLADHGGPCQLFGFDGLEDCQNPTWVGSTVYRVKPAPPQPREWWLTKCGGYTHCHDSRLDADVYAHANRNQIVTIFHVVEVLP